MRPELLCRLRRHVPDPRIEYLFLARRLNDVNLPRLQECGRREGNTRDHVKLFCPDERDVVTVTLTKETA